MQKNHLTILLLIIIVTLLGVWFFSRHDANYRATRPTSRASSITNLVENRKTKITDNYYLTASFSERPKVGTIMLKVEIVDKKGNKITLPKIITNYDMPSMRGHHPSGDVALSLSRNNDYIAPVHLVMRGAWEVVIKVLEKDKEIYLGHILFTI